MDDSIKDTKYQKLILTVSLIVLGLFGVSFITDSLDLFELIGMGDSQSRSRQQPIILILVALLLAIYSARNLVINKKVHFRTNGGLSNAPQLFPYFFSAESFNLRWKDANLSLIPVQDVKTNVADYLRIETESNEILGLIGFWNYLKPIDESKFICYNTYDLDKEFLCHIEFIDTALLKPIPKVMSNHEYLKGSHNDRFFNGTTIKISIPSNLKIGINPFTFPENLKEVSEFTVIATKDDIYEDQQMAQYWEKYVLLLLRPNLSEIEVICMDWFNKSEVDHGYVWPARIGRSSVDNKLYGEGMRMSSFVLDSTGQFRVDI
jgi:hypothetical protein